MKSGDYCFRIFQYIIMLASFISIAILYYLNLRSYIFLSISVFIGSLIYYISDCFDRVNFEFKFIIRPASNNIKYIINILFFFCYILSILYLLDYFFTKGIEYYILISLCSFLIFLDIFTEGNKNWDFFCIIKIFFLVINLFYSNQIVFPVGIGGSDSFGHVLLARYIFNEGYVPSQPIPQVVYSRAYSFFPIQHIISVIGSLITTIDIKIFYINVATFLVILIVLYIINLGKRFFSLYFGALSALVFSASDYIIYWASHPDKLSFGLFFSVICFYCVMLRGNRNASEYSLLFLIGSCALVFTHQFSTMTFFFILIFVSLVDVYESKNFINVLFIPSLVFIYLVIYLAHWIFYSFVFDVFLDVIIGHIDAFSSDAAEAISSPMRYDLIPVLTIFFNTLGSNILMLLSIIGLLGFVKYPSYFKKRIVAVTFIIFPLIIVGVVLYVANMGYLLPNRLYAFSESMALAFLSSYGIIFLFNLSNSKAAKIIVLLLLTSFVFFSSSSTIAGFETSLFSNDLAYPKVYSTPYEERAFYWFDDNLRATKYNTYFSDSFKTFSSNFNKYDYKKLPISEDGIIRFDLMTMPHIIIFSNFDYMTGVITSYKGASHVGESKYTKLKLNSVEKLNKYNSVYSNRYVVMYKGDQYGPQ